MASRKIKDQEKKQLSMYERELSKIDSELLFRNGQRDKAFKILTGKVTTKNSRCGSIGRGTS
jgi:hypothetical protein